MQQYRMKYNREFISLCNEYSKTHSYKETADKFQIKYKTLLCCLLRFGFRKPSRIGSYNKKVSYDNHYFDKIDTDKKAYFLGLLMSDGYLCKSDYSYVLGIALQYCDKYILEEFKKDIKSLSKLNDYKNSSKFSIKCDKNILCKLRKYGMIENKSHSDYIVPKISKKHFNAFVRGYFDGDGCITLKSQGNSVTSICCNSLCFLESLKEKLEKYVKIKNIRLIKEFRGRINPIYVLYISTKEGQKMFRDYIYKNAEIKLIRKYDKFQKIPC